jgi:hypothetical protein
MTYTYDPTTDIGRIRRTIPDKVEDDAFWTDEELQSFLLDEGDWRRATALALETMASDDLLVLKVIKIQNIETNTDRMASALMKRAQKLRDLAVEADANCLGYCRICIRR